MHHRDHDPDRIHRGDHRGHRVHPDDRRRSRAARRGHRGLPGRRARVNGVDVDLTKLKLEPHEAETMNRQLSALAADQRGDQLQRLERSLLRLERINVQTLAMLQKLVNAARRGGPDEGKP